MLEDSEFYDEVEDEDEDEEDCCLSTDLDEASTFLVDSFSLDTCY